MNKIIYWTGLGLLFLGLLSILTATVFHPVPPMLYWFSTIGSKALIFGFFISVFSLAQQQTANKKEPSSAGESQKHKMPFVYKTGACLLIGGVCLMVYAFSVHSTSLSTLFGALYIAAFGLLIGVAGLILMMIGKGSTK